jgi:methylphosphotriester-DNA--protein-cysteine methyltransferase
LTRANGKTYESRRPGSLGGHRGTRIYGRLDCSTALRAIARGGYVSQGVFFLDERMARKAGYRPCATCMPRQYRAWKNRQGRKNRSARRARSK